MKALVWTAVGKMEIRDVEKPKPQPGWVLLRVSYAGVCGSDIGGFLGKNELRRPPLIMGHEFTGVVEEVGPGVSKDLIGRLFTVNPIIGCGHCRYCRNGLKNLCIARKIIGIEVVWVSPIGLTRTAFDVRTNVKRVRKTGSLLYIIRGDLVDLGSRTFTGVTE